MSEGTQRRLSAIVAVDVVGYSSLVQMDEARAHRRLESRYQDLVAPSIDRYDGRVVKLNWDGLFAVLPFPI